MPINPETGALDTSTELTLQLALTAVADAILLPTEDICKGVSKDVKAVMDTIVAQPGWDNERGNILQIEIVRCFMMIHRSVRSLMTSVFKEFSKDPFSRTLSGNSNISENYLSPHEKLKDLVLISSIELKISINKILNTIMFRIIFTLIGPLSEVGVKQLFQLLRLLDQYRIDHQQITQIVNQFFFNRDNFHHSFCAEESMMEDHEGEFSYSNELDLLFLTFDLYLHLNTKQRLEIALMQAMDHHFDPRYRGPQGKAFAGKAILYNSIRYDLLLSDDHRKYIPAYNPQESERIGISMQLHETIRRKHAN